MPLRPIAVRLRDLLIAVAVWSVCTPAAAATFRCRGGDVPCLIDAITIANGNGERNTIRLSGDTYSVTTADNFGTSSTDANAFPVIVGDITIVGVAPEATIIERADYLNARFSNFFRFFTVAATGRLALQQLMLRGGNTNEQAGRAGAIQSNGVLTVTGAVIASNRAGQAGAIAVDSGTFILRDSRVVDNLVGFGQDIVAIGRFSGGTLPPEPASALIEHSTFTDNQIASGGAIHVHLGNSATITETSVIRNSGSGTTLGSNGVVQAEGRLTLQNSTIHSTFPGFFAAALVAGTDSLVTNSNLVNVAPQTSTVVSVYGGVRVQNTILASDTLSGDCLNLASFTSLGHNLIQDPHNCPGALQESDLVGTPGLGPLVDSGRPGGQYFTLLDDSRATDAGDLTACPSTDQRRLPRSIDGNGDGVRACDIGAVEFYPIVNDFLSIGPIRSSFMRSHPRQDEPYAAGGEYRITATLTNTNGPRLCHIALDFITLQPAAIAPALLTRDGDLIGREGVTAPATLLGARPDLRPGEEESYRFYVGVAAPDPISFVFNVLGEPSDAHCQEGNYAMADALSVGRKRDPEAAAAKTSTK